MNTAGEPNVVWARIIDANWATRVLTMSTAVIRTAMATQASLATAMLAAVVLETIDTPLVQGLIYSVIRAVQAAPTILLLTAELRPKGRLSTLVFTLVVIEILVTLASQFFSTIFISDFEVSINANIINATDVSTLDTDRLKCLQPQAGHLRDCQNRSPKVRIFTIRDTHIEAFCLSGTKVIEHTCATSAVLQSSWITK